MNFEDFLTDDILTEGKQMPLLKGGEPTDHWLHVIGAASRSVTRDRIRWAINREAIDSKYEEVEDKEKLLVDKAEEGEANDMAFALKLVTAWSFDKFSKSKLKQLLSANQGLSFLVIAFAYEQDGEREKK